MWKGKSVDELEAERLEEVDELRALRSGQSGRQDEAADELDAYYGFCQVVAARRAVD